MPPSAKTAVLLLAHGSPESAEDVPCFLYAVTAGRPLPQTVIDEVQRRYALIGRSPLRDLTLQQAEALQRELGLPVYVGMRNWTPYIREAAPRMASDGITHAIVVCLTPQNSRTSVGLYRQALEEAQPVFTFDFVESWHDQPLLIQALAGKLEAGWKQACAEAGARIPVIFTAHSVPASTIMEGDPYEEQARQTAELTARRVAGLSAREWRFAFQSQGMSGGTWLGPTVEETIRELASTGGGGHAGIFLQPVGFLCDNVEILYDIDILFKKFAAECGLRLWRAESLNASPLLTAALAAVVRSRQALSP
jgi:ferrochelatase